MHRDLLSYGPCVDPWLTCTGGGQDEIEEFWEPDCSLVDYPLTRQSASTAATMAGMSYESFKLHPFRAYKGAEFLGAELRGEEGTEPDELVLRFADRPDLVVSVWHGTGASGFDIETAET